MPNPAPDHYFEQAARLIAPPPAGPPRQVDLRRAISAAYYGVFHGLSARVADELIGVTLRATPSYAAVYRSIGHTWARDLCEVVQKTSLRAKYRRLGLRSFGDRVQRFAAAFQSLQLKRHEADYDPTLRFLTSDGELALATARPALADLDAANDEERKVFLTLLALGSVRI